MGLAIQGLQLPFKEWPSFKWEEPLFWWFLGFAMVLGGALAVILNMVNRKRRLMDLEWTVEPKEKSQ